MKLFFHIKLLPSLIQDTVIALQGLSVAAALVYSDTIDIRVTIGTRPVKTGQVFNINAQNAQVLQMMDVS
ncbi:hypothetical protein DPMN_116579 [Dreissena polymorpha]|uniref:Uncharacterized protein n=1 Tax=Dreissena polymorpha TaxID=45954 RepID=A0A9D4KPP7_DREPO|nr:hypothetical protein DPMN_116579 [Dreissena polymorpha]